MANIIYFFFSILLISFQGFLCGVLVACMTLTSTTIIMTAASIYMVLGTALLLAATLSGLSR